MSHMPNDDASSMSDDVFEDSETTEKRVEETRRRTEFVKTAAATDYNYSQAALSGYPGYRPPREALQLYALQDTEYQHDLKDYDDGWRSYRYDEVGMYSQHQQQQQPFDDTVNHKTILLGDSGVGKTSFLVKYNTGEFRLGSFSATVGIALTMAQCRCRVDCVRIFSVLPVLETSMSGGSCITSIHSLSLTSVLFVFPAERVIAFFKERRFLQLLLLTLHTCATSIVKKMRRTSLCHRNIKSSGKNPPALPSVHINGNMMTSKRSSSASASEFNSIRRESLVKPTWQHITPGQIPPKTLDKINGITSYDSDEDEHTKCSTNVSIVTLLSNNTSGIGVESGNVASCDSFVINRATLPWTTRSYGLVVHNDGPSTSKICAGSSGGNGNRRPIIPDGGKIIHMLSSTVNIEDYEDYDILGKVIMLGDSGVGKTCLLIRFRDGKYMPNYYITTVGIDFRNKVVVVDGTRVKLQIWDTAGQERFRSVTHAYYRDAHALLLLYDVTNKTTYDNIRAWLGEIREYAQDDVVIVLIGNKADCSSGDRQVKREEGERLAREHSVPFMETSAKTGLNVELAFAAVARQLKCRGNDNDDNGKFNVHDFVRDNTKARTICAQCKSM